MVCASRGGIRCAALGMAMLVLAGCSSPPAGIIGLDGASFAAADVLNATAIDIFVATTRTPSAEATRYFSGERSEALHFARVTVSIPPNHVVGQVERPKRLPPDPRSEFVVLDPEPLPDARDFVASVDAALARKPAGSRDLLLFVHGYNTDFTSAVLRAAQFAHDSKFRGITVLFTWASRGQTLEYVYDINSALQARDALLETGAALSMTRADRLDILAHSMGNLLTVEAIRQRALSGEWNASGKINAVILAAPDIDIDLFRRQLRAVDVGNPPIYVLISDDDKALAISSRIAGKVPRVGDANPAELEALGVKVIDLTTVTDTESINHTKFANAPGVVQMIGSSILSGAHPAAREPDRVPGALTALGAILPVPRVAQP